MTTKKLYKVGGELLTASQWKQKVMREIDAFLKHAELMDVSDDGNWAIKIDLLIEEA